LTPLSPSPTNDIIIVKAQQPNFEVLLQSLMAIHQQVALFPNMFHDLAKRLNENNLRLDNNQQQLVDLLQRFLNNVTYSYVSQQLMPMRCFNTNISKNIPVRYPAGIPTDNLPLSWKQLSNFTAHQYQTAAAVLGLPAMPPNTCVEARQEQIANYLGIPS
ncbi:hypothetical protein RUND412_011459, partial [Rhizina undulata]